MLSTKEKILESGLAVFLEKGYSGASISQIAKQADINQSLVYHHYKSKEDLWCHVKQYCVDEATSEFQAIRHDSLEHFVEDLIEARFSVYAKGGMRMLVHWQALERDTAQFYGSKLTPHPLFDIADHIIALQNNKLVRDDQDHQVLSGVIFGLASYAFFDYADAFELPEEKRASYKKMVKDILIHTLKK